MQVPGGANDSLSSNTKLGRAVDDACAELEALGKLVSSTPALLVLQVPGLRLHISLSVQERDQQLQASELLRKLGISEDMLLPRQSPPPPPSGS